MRSSCPSRAVSACVVALACAWSAAVRPVRAADVPQRDSSETPAARSETGPAPGIVELAPELYYLEDESGRLVPVPGFRYRDFLELFRMKEGLPGPVQPPDAVLESVRLEADLTAIDTAAGTCPATVRCSIRQTRGGWVTAALALDGLVFDAAPRHEGPGRLLVAPDPDAPGYRCWLEAPVDAGGETRHEVTLAGRLAVDVTAAGTSLAVRLPVATASLVTLLAPADAPQITVLPPFSRPVIEAVAAGRSSVRLEGLSGDVRIRVAGPDATAGPPAIPQSFVDAIVRIDGRTATTTATIRLADLAADTKEVRVVLPAGAVLDAVRGDATGFERGSDKDRPVAIIAIAPPQSGEATIELECGRPIDRAAGPNKDSAAFEAVGFGIEGIEPGRQWGRVSLLVEGEWQAIWNDSLRRTDPPPAARGPGFVAAFAYDATPASLQIRVRPRRGRVVIEPTYRYDVSAERIALQAQFRVAATGAAATEMTLAIDPSWSIDDVGPPGLVDDAGVTTEPGRIVIPFLQGLLGEAIVEIRGGRTIARDSDRVQWDLPVPGPGTLGPATVVIAADSDIELVPDAAAIAGLARQPTPALPGVEGERTALAYRLDAPKAAFAATRRFLPQRVEATIATRADIDDAATVVAEVLRLAVFHVPLEFIDLAVPDAVAESASLEVRQGGMLLDPVEVEVAEEQAGAGTRRVRVVLPTPLLGRGEIDVRYRLPTPVVPPDTTVADDVPLVLPASATVTQQTLVVAAPARLAVEMRGDTWRRDDGPANAATPWFTTRPQAGVPLAISARRRSAARDATVDAAWLLTRLRPDSRTDVWSYALAATTGRVVIALPAGARASGAADFRVDGRTIDVVVGEDGRASIDLPQAEAEARCLLEIRATTPRGGWAGLGGWLAVPERIVLEPPAFAEGVIQRRFYWEIESQPDDHVLGAPRRWTSQQRWKWNAIPPARVPAASRPSLAAWLRAAARLDEPAATGGADPGWPADGAEPDGVERRALYSGFGRPDVAGVWLLPTWFLVLVASGPALAAGLAVSACPWLRTRTALLACGTLLAVGWAAFPDATGLLAMAALPGCVLALLAAALRGRSDRRHPAAGRAAASAGLASASSLTRALPSSPSLIVASSSIRSVGAAPSGRMP